MILHALLVLVALVALGGPALLAVREHNGGRHNRSLARIAHLERSMGLELTAADPYSGNGHLWTPFLFELEGTVKEVHPAPPAVYLDRVGQLREARRQDGLRQELAMKRMADSYRRMVARPLIEPEPAHTPRVQGDGHATS